MNFKRRLTMKRPKVGYKLAFLCVYTTLTVELSSIILFVYFTFFIIILFWIGADYVGATHQSNTRLKPLWSALYFAIRFRPYELPPNARLCLLLCSLSQWMVFMFVLFSPRLSLTLYRLLLSVASAVRSYVYVCVRVRWAVVLCIGLRFPATTLLSSRV